MRDAARIARRSNRFRSLMGFTESLRLLSTSERRRRDIERRSAKGPGCRVGCHRPSSSSVSGFHDYDYQRSSMALIADIFPELSSLLEPVSEGSPAGVDLDGTLELNALEMACAEPEGAVVPGIESSDQ